MTPALICFNSRCDNVQASSLQCCLDHFCGVVDRDNMCGDTGLLSPGKHCEAACLKPNLLTCRHPNNLALLAKTSLRCRSTFFAMVCTLAVELPDSNYKSKPGNT